MSTDASRTAHTVAGSPTRFAMTPVVHRVVARTRETDDVVTLCLEPVDGPRMDFLPGQFNMLSAFGVGEVPWRLLGSDAD